MKIKKEDNFKSLIKSIQNKGPIQITDSILIQLRTSTRTEIRNSKLQQFKVCKLEIFSLNQLIVSNNYESFKSLHKDLLKFLKQNNLSINDLTIAVKEKI